MQEFTAFAIFSTRTGDKYANWNWLLRVYRAETSQKAMRGVDIADLAAYIDKRRAAALRARDQLCGLD